MGENSRYVSRGFLGGEGSSRALFVLCLCNQKNEKASVPLLRSVKFQRNRLLPYLHGATSVKESKPWESLFPRDFRLEDKGHAVCQIESEAKPEPAKNPFRLPPTLSQTHSWLHRISSLNFFCARHLMEDEKSIVPDQDGSSSGFRPSANLVRSTLLDPQKQSAELTLDMDHSHRGPRSKSLQDGKLIPPESSL